MPFLIASTARAAGTAGAASRRPRRFAPAGRCRTGPSRRRTSFRSRPGHAGDRLGLTEDRAGTDPRADCGHPAVEELPGHAVHGEGHDADPRFCRRPVSRSCPEPPPARPDDVQSHPSCRRASHPPAPAPHPSADLPQPDGPIRARNSADWMDSSSPCGTFCPSTLFVRPAGRADAMGRRVLLWLRSMPAAASCHDPVPRAARRP